MHAALRVDVARVRVHGIERDDELIADEWAAAPRQEQRGDLRLALGKPIARLEFFRRLLEDGGELLPRGKRHGGVWLKAISSIARGVHATCSSMRTALGSARESDIRASRNATHNAHIRASARAPRACRALRRHSELRVGEAAHGIAQEQPARVEAGEHSDERNRPRRDKRQVRKRGRAGVEKRQRKGERQGNSQAFRSKQAAEQDKRRHADAPHVLRCHNPHAHLNAEHGDEVDRVRNAMLLGNAQVDQQKAAADNHERHRPAIEEGEVQEARLAHTGKKRHDGEHRRNGERHKVVHEAPAVHHRRGRHAEQGELEPDEEVQHEKGAQVGKLPAHPGVSELASRLPIGGNVSAAPRAEHDPRGHDGQNGIHHHEQRALHRQKHEVHDKRDHERQRHGRFDVLLIAVAETRPPQNAEQRKPRAAAQATRHGERGVPRKIEMAHPDENGPDARATGADHADHALRRIPAPLLAQ